MAAFGAWAQPVAASINAAATVGAAEIGASAQDRTNKSNQLIAEQNNQAQIDLWREQQAHDLDMWERENMYNDPSAQQKRLMDAGLSPLMVGEGAAGNATSFAGGQTPPQLNTPVMQNPYGSDFVNGISRAFDVQSYAQAYKAFAEGKKTSSEAGIAGFELDAYKEHALKGENPFLYKAGIMLQEYNKLKKENKWIDPVTEATLKRIGSETDLNREFRKVRVQECMRIQAETKGITLQNHFNAKVFPEQIREIAARITQIETLTKDQHNLAGAQINAANASTKVSEAQSENIVAQTKGINFDNVQKELKAELSKIGINVDSNSLPFFVGIAARMAQGQITDNDVVEYFEQLQYANRIGWKKLADSNADLTKFQMFNVQDKSILNQFPMMLRLIKDRMGRN